MQFIEEWATLDFHSLRGKIILLTLLGMAVLNLVRRRTWPLHELLFAAIVVYGALTYSRFAFLAGIVLAPMAAFDVRGALGPYRAAQDGIGRNVVALAVLLLLVVWRMPSAATLQAGLTDAFPEQALPRMAALPADARVFNQFEWGAYLFWNQPRRRTFIDARTDIFVHEGVMADYALASNTLNSLQVLDKWRIDYALLPPVGFDDLSAAAHAGLDCGLPRPEGHFVQKSRASARAIK